MRAKSIQLCLTPCDPMDCSLPDPSVHRLSQYEYWSGLPSPSPGGLPNPEIKPTSLRSPASAGMFFTSTTGEALGVPLYIQSNCPGEDWGTQDGSPCREVPAPAYFKFTQNFYLSFIYFYYLIKNFFLASQLVRS